MQEVDENECECEVDKIQLFYDTHYNKKKQQWVDESSKHIYVSVLVNLHCVDT